MRDELELLIDCKSIIGEGPCWDKQGQLLFWIDIAGKKVHIYDPKKNSNQTIETGQFVGCIALRESGGAILALQNGFYFLDLGTEKLTPIIDPEKDLKMNRFNDGKCDCYGRFWAGTQSSDGAGGAGDAEGTASLYFLDTDRSVKKVFGNVSISNGITWSPDNKIMYYIDSKKKEVVAYNFIPESGKVSNKCQVIEIPEEHGIPDGMTTDEEGMLWIAEWDGYQVCRWDPNTGKLLRRIRLPVAKVTSCAFGGPCLDELYITTARMGVRPDDCSQHHAGGVFKINPGVRGVEFFKYGG